MRLTVTVDLDFLDRVKLVNYVRSEVKEGRSLTKEWSPALFEDEQFLKPTMEDDAVLYSLDDIDDSALSTEAPMTNGEHEVQELQEQLAQLQAQFAAYREGVQASFQKQMDSIKESPTNNQPNTQLPSSSQQEQDTGYFSSYSTSTIHESMLKDTIRTDAYRDFIYDNKHLFAGKTVLDVGCGTGILSLFCAKAGATTVLSVDNSSIIDKARVIVYANNMQHVIKCLHGKIEEIKLPVDKVDIIVSEWMGYGLLYESMLDSVLWARDRYLDPVSGLMVPSHAVLRIAPLLDSETRISHIDFWKCVYGFDMSCMLDDIYNEALVRSIDPNDISSSSVPFLELDLHTAKTTDLTFLHDFELKFNLPASGSQSQFDGFALWFDIFFCKSRSSSESSNTTANGVPTTYHNSFTTSAHAPQTHWQQVALLAKTPQILSPTPSQTKDKAENGNGNRNGEAMSLRGKISYQKREGRDRSVDIEVMWSIEPGRGKDGEDVAQGEAGAKQEQRQVWTLD